MQIENKSVLSMPLLKKFALEILNGTKKREYRAFTDHWARRLCVFEDENDKYLATGIKHYDIVHFYPYNNKWYLDVRVENIGWYTVDDELIAEFSHEVELPPIGQQIFIITLGEVIDTNLPRE